MRVSLDVAQSPEFQSRIHDLGNDPAGLADRIYPAFYDKDKTAWS